MLSVLCVAAAQALTAMARPTTAICLIHCPRVVM
jgi:hypothetical protein